MTIRQYLKSYYKILLLILLGCLINTTVFFIYGNDLEPILYALVIYLIFLIFFGVMDYRLKKGKHELLLSYDIMTDKNLSELILEHNILAADYQNIIQRLKKLHQNNLSDRMKKEKELSDFYTLWVHQIKTPIAALRLLLKTSPENISGMKSELFKIERYVDIILGYLRIDDINSDLLLKHYSLDSMVKQAVKKYSPLFIQSKLSLNLENLSHCVLTDEKWFVFVLEQLISNAIKYTLTGGIKMESYVTTKNNLHFTAFIIQDTGIGIYPEDLPRIFERSYTGYNGRNDKKASGLGLYLCKTVLNRLGHEISITSKPKQGTCVTITFIEDKNLTNL